MNCFPLPLPQKILDPLLDIIHRSMHLSLSVGGWIIWPHSPTPTPQVHNWNPLPITAMYTVSVLALNALPNDKLSLCVSWKSARWMFCLRRRNPAVEQALCIYKEFSPQDKVKRWELRVLGWGMNKVTSFIWVLVCTLYPIKSTSCT